MLSSHLQLVIKNHFILLCKEILYLQGLVTLESFNLPNTKIIWEERGLHKLINLQPLIMQTD